MMITYQNFMCALKGSKITLNTVDFLYGNKGMIGKLDLLFSPEARFPLHEL